MISNKVFWMTLITAVFSVLRVALPDLPLSVEVEAAIQTIVTFIVGFFVKETDATLARLQVRR